MADPHPEYPWQSAIDPAKPKKRGCLFWGLIGASVILALMLIAGLAGGVERQADKNRAAAPASSSAAPSSSAATPAPSTASSEPSLQPSMPTTSSEALPPARPPQAAYSPFDLIPFPLNQAEKRTTYRLDATDIARHLIDGVNRERRILDQENWRVISACEKPFGGTVKVGVIKNDEFSMITRAQVGAGISSNDYAFMLDCPR